MTFDSCTCQLWTIALAQECECLQLRYLVLFTTPQLSMSALDGIKENLPLINNSYINKSYRMVTRVTSHKE